jgi:hypothetical protein
MALDYRVESTHPIVGPLMPANGAVEFLLEDRSLAVVVAAKSVTRPYGQEIRVVHVPSGEVVYRKTASTTTNALED